MWLLIGGDSEIGAAAADRLRRDGHDIAATTRRPERAGPGTLFLDFARPLDGFEPPSGTTAACIFAAVARLGACAADPEGSAHVNVTQALALVDRLTARDVFTVFLSTDKVFDGSGPHVPADAPTSPACVYGAQKARTEAGLRERMERGAPVAILRLTKIISPKTALLRQWDEALRAGRPIRAFADMTMAPVPVDIVVDAITALMRERVTGVFQLSGPRDVTYLEAGRHIARRAGADPALVEAGTITEAGLPKGSAPPHTTLDISGLRERFGIVVPDAFEVIDAVLANGCEATSRG